MSKLNPDPVRVAAGKKAAATRWANEKRAHNEKARALRSKTAEAQTDEQDDDHTVSDEETIDWLEKGLAEWRDLSEHNARVARAAQATARVAVGHLQAVLNKARTHAEQQAADTAARDWLISIGSEPN
jgi:hypothetical protein